MPFTTLNDEEEKELWRLASLGASMAIRLMLTEKGASTSRRWRTVSSNKSLKKRLAKIDRKYNPRPKKIVSGGLPKLGKRRKRGQADVKFRWLSCNRA